MKEAKKQIWDMEGEGEPTYHTTKTVEELVESVRGARVPVANSIVGVATMNGQRRYFAIAVSTGSIEQNCEGLASHLKQTMEKRHEQQP